MHARKEAKQLCKNMVSKNAPKSLKCLPVSQRIRTFLLDHNKLHFQPKTSWHIEVLLEHRIWLAMSDWPPPEKHFKALDHIKACRKLAGFLRNPSKVAKQTSKTWHIPVLRQTFWNHQICQRGELLINHHKPLSQASRVVKMRQEAIWQRH